MVSTQSVERQLKRLKFNLHAWGKSEVKELPHILMPDEEIYECVNGIYEGGFALLVATDMRILLIDKKPLNFLTVEDMRFDMITELDYSHRMIGAQISISAGSKNLKFKSYNQQRLRKLITHVQHCIAEGKKQVSAGQQDQKQHLEQINQQLQAYLIAQHQQQQAFREQLSGGNNRGQADLPPAPKPSPELSDFLFAQSLLKQYREQEAIEQKAATTPEAETRPVTSPVPTPATANTPASPQLAELYADGMQEIFGRQKTQQPTTPAPTPSQQSAPTEPVSSHLHNPLEINPLSIAYSKLPMALRNRKFGRPSFHAHSQVVPPAQPGQQPIPAH